MTGFPRASTMDDYARASADLEQALTALPGIVAVYRYGSVAAPGISDLDRVAVVEGSGPVESIWPNLSEDTQYLAMHTPALVDVSTFLQHRWFAEMSGLECAWGELLLPEERPVPEYSEPLLAVEALVVSAIKLAKLALTRRVKVRPLLCELRNVGLDLRLAKIDRAQAPSAWALADEIEETRKEWWELSDSTRRIRVDAIVSQAPIAISDAIDAIGEEHGDPSFSAKPMPLSGAWSNVTLVPDATRSDKRKHRASKGLPFIARSRRLGEARWRSRRRQFVVSPSVIGLLSGNADPRYADFRKERSELVTRHTRHLAGSSGYSGIAVGTAFGRG